MVLKPSGFILVYALGGQQGEVCAGDRCIEYNLQVCCCLTIPAKAWTLSACYPEVKLPHAAHVVPRDCQPFGQTICLARASKPHHWIYALINLDRCSSIKKQLVLG
jgi:hypothetical protein